MSKAPPTPQQQAADQALRDDVRLLGDLLGQVLSDLGGPPLLDRVEEARRLARDRRGGMPGAEAELGRQLAGLSPAAARELTRAFSSFFALANLAEQVHRIRRRREQSRDERAPQPGSLAAVLRELAGQGLGLAQVRETLSQLEVMPVFTAHPTRAMRRTLLVKSQRMARSLLIRLDQGDPTPREAARTRAELRRQIELAWQTEEQPTARPTVADEVEYVLFHLIEVVYQILPGFYESLAQALEDAYGPGAGQDLPCPLIRFGSWVGGDMDGNPNVGPATIRATLERQRRLILERYRTDLGELCEEFSQSQQRVRVAPAVLERVAAYRDLLPERAARLPRRSADMPYRLLLNLMQARVEAALADGPGAYAQAADLLDDLALIRTSLLAPGGGRGGLPLLQALERRVLTFGFHLATLDVRQDSELHRRVAGLLLGDESFAGRRPEERAAALRLALQQPAPAAQPEPADEECRRSLDVLRTLAEMRRRHGRQALGPYIISMAQGADDLLALLYLARRAGLQDEQGAVELDIAPLFETVDDLQQASATLASMLEDEVYRAHLATRGQRQLVMLGYSDSSKISGIAASRWALYQVQEELARQADEAGVELSFFHGRGGTVGRGGSKPRSAILADPCGALRGRLRLTEQGEIVHAKYGLRGIAERTLELLTGAVLETTTLCSPRSHPEPGWARAMELIAASGRADYQMLVHDHPAFHDYFRLATPIDVIERLEIGSRPASRRSGRGVENLRAIPWVFAWTQNRHLLPAWFGIGHGLEAAARAHGESQLAEMAARWPFFANLLADLSMVLAKADLEIAARYAELAGSAGLEVFPIIRQRWLETRTWVLKLRGEDELLDREPALQRSIRLRNPYVDPMSLLQVDLLARWRAGNREDAELERALFETVRGISQGLQNTG
ncbi:MAG: phosphoenolpyruvate carboxylase [Candidatus Delongbacteria bacterium]